MQRIKYILSAKNPAYRTPDLLADAVRKAGGLTHNNHPMVSARDQWSYSPHNYNIFANTEIYPDRIVYRRKTHLTWGERTIRDFLNKGGVTGLIGASDSHDGRPEARSAVWAQKLTRLAIFAALAQRHNYAVFNGKLFLDLRLNRHLMGDRFCASTFLQLEIRVQAPRRIERVELIHNGRPFQRWHPHSKQFYWRGRLPPARRTLSPHPNARRPRGRPPAASYYYVRVVTERNDHGRMPGNPTYAWSSPIWPQVCQRR